MKRYAVGRKVKGIIRKKGLFLQDGYKIEEKSDGMIFHSKINFFAILMICCVKVLSKLIFNIRGEKV